MERGHRNVKSLDSYIDCQTDKQHREPTNTRQRVATTYSFSALNEINKCERHISWHIAFSSSLGEKSTARFKHVQQRYNHGGRRGTYYINVVNKE